MDKLRIVAVASSEETRSALYNQLKDLAFVEFNGVLLELSDAVRLCQEKKPDVIILELSGREVDGGLFIQAISMNPDYPCVTFALHRELEHQTILEAVRQGAKDFIRYPQEKEKLEDALNKHRNFLKVQTQSSVSESGGPAGNLITVFSAKGGSGCTTTAVNLAHELHATTHKPVVLFDLDQVFSNTALLLNLKPEYSLGDLADNNASEIDEMLLQRIIMPHESGLGVVVATKSVLDDHEMISPELLGKTVDFLKQKYAYIVVDLPTHVLDPYHQFMVDASDELLLVSNLDIPGLYRTRQYLDLAKIHVDMSKIKLVLNRHNLKSAYGISNKNLEDEFRYPVHCRLPNDWELMVEANSLGRVLSKVNPNADLSKAFTNLAGLYSTPHVEQHEEQASQQAGLLNKFFNKKHA